MLEVLQAALDLPTILELGTMKATSHRQMKWPILYPNDSFCFSNRIITPRCQVLFCLDTSVSCCLFFPSFAFSCGIISHFILCVIQFTACLHWTSALSVDYIYSAIPYAPGIGSSHENDVKFTGITISCTVGMIGKLASR
jgi:hypothetical protein